MDEEIQVIKYRIYEVIASYENGKNFKIIGLMSAKQFNKKYGDKQIISIKNYDDTHTTSIILRG